jgi:hypothetical protein
MAAYRAFVKYINAVTGGANIRGTNHYSLPARRLETLAGRALFAVSEPSTKRLRR